MHASFDTRTDAPDGPRERLARVGAERLADAELIALLLGTGTRGESVSVLASRLLDAHGGLAGLSRLGAGGLAEVHGIGYGKAARLVAGFELGIRVASRPLARGGRIASSRDVDAALRPRLATAEAERFVAIAMDSRNRIIAELVLGHGGSASCPVSPADVYRTLLREGATGAIFAHNHPSGDPTPSEDDVRLTARLCEAGELLGIRVLDHVVVGREGYVSFLDAGLLPRAPERGWP